MATYAKAFTVAAAASLLVMTDARAEAGEASREPFEVNRLVYDGSGDEPVFLADKSLQLRERTVKVVREL